MKRIITVLLCVMLLFSSGFVLLDFEEEAQGRIVEQDGVMYTTHTPIRIDSDADFDLAHGVVNWDTGNGTIWNPWIIDDWDIDGTGYGYCIYIGNTTDHFVVMGCYLHGAGGVTIWPYFPNSGLVIYNVQNGTITNNDASSNSNSGIRLDSSSHISINNNTVSSNTYYGICLEYSNNITVENNVASTNNDGIILKDSNNNTVTSNSATSNDNSGICLDTSNNNILTYNTMSGDGIFIWGSAVENWITQTIDTTNTANGKPVYYYKNTSFEYHVEDLLWKKSSNQIHYQSYLMQL